MNKICVVTGSRAEYGLLRRIMIRIKEEEDLELQLIVTGMHLDTRYGLTYHEIEQDGIQIDERIEMNLATDSASGICKSIGIEMIGLSEAYDRLKPDMLLLLGDRYEIFAAASASVFHKIPIAHIHGGEITEGAYDDCMRHAITKMSYLHFTSAKEYRQRVIQLGEEPERVYQVGALGIENIKKMKLLSRKELKDVLKLSLKQPYALVTLHPETLDNQQVENQFTILAKALEFYPKLYVIFTKSNSDTGGIRMNHLVEDYVNRNRKRAACFTSLGTLVYLSLMRHSQMVIGNSSSGILEAPYMKVPAIDIGSRQKGRVKPGSVIGCAYSTKEIIAAIQTAISFDWNKIEKGNPFEGEDTSSQIVTIMKNTLKSGINLKKKFYDMDKSL